MGIHIPSPYDPRQRSRLEGRDTDHDAGEDHIRVVGQYIPIGGVDLPPVAIYVCRIYRP